MLYSFSPVFSRLILHIVSCEVSGCIKCYLLKKTIFINNRTYNYKDTFLLAYQEVSMLTENPHEQNIRICFSNLFEIQYNF